MNNNHIKAESIKKSQNLKKEFFSDFYHSSWGGTLTQISQPRGGRGKNRLGHTDKLSLGTLHAKF